MKLIRPAIIACFAMMSIPAFSQLKDSKWMATFKIPSEVSCYFSFGKDTLDMTEVENDRLLEQMAYTIKSDTIIFTKLTGGSPCENDAQGIYRWKIDGNVFKMNLISDSCDGRSAAGFDGTAMHRVLPSPAKKE